MRDWTTRAALAGCAFAMIGLSGPAAAQSVPAPETATAAVPASFTSAAQARVYLSQNPGGARAEAAFRMIAFADIAARNPELDPAQIAAGSAIQIMPGAIATPVEIEAVINATTPGIGRRERGLF